MSRSLPTAVMVMIATGAAVASGLPMRSSGPGATAGERVLKDDVQFLAGRVRGLPPGTGLPVDVGNLRFDSEPLSTLANQGDIAWASAVARVRSTAVAKDTESNIPALVSQSYQGHFAVSIVGRGAVAGKEPDDVLAVVQDILDRQSMDRMPSLRKAP
jgi:hypothetical protein